MGKKFKFMMIVVLSIVLVIAGCSGGGSSKDSGSTTTTPAKTAAPVTAESNLTAPGEFPIVKERVELTILVAGDARIEDMATNRFTLWYEELTNVKINWEIAPEGSIPETLNLRLASGDYPDIFMRMGVSRAQEMIYGPQGVFLSLNDLIEEQGFYIKEMFDVRPQYYDNIVTPDGNIYSLPAINECYHCSLQVKMWINQNFLDAVNKPVPTTTEDFYQTLKAFKDQDPNGTGRADTIPLIGAVGAGAWNGAVWPFIMNAFTYAPPTFLYLEDDEVTASFVKDGWFEGLKYMNKLYAEGLLAGESFTQDAQQLRQLTENPDFPIVGAFTAGWFGVGTQYGSDSDRWKQYATSVPPLEGPNGLRISTSFPYQLSTGRAVITNKAKHPEVAFRWLEGFYKDEINIRSNQGEPGTDWVEAKPGMKGIDGRPAKREMLTSYSTVSQTQWYQKAPEFTSDDIRLEVAAGENPEENLEVILFNQTNSNYEPFRAPIEMVLPPLYFSEDQSTEIADLLKTMTDYVDQMIARFITGDITLNDNEWQNYLKTVENMNLKRLLAIYQESYNSTR